MRRTEAWAITLCGGFMVGCVSTITVLLAVGVETGLSGQAIAAVLVSAMAGGASLVLGLWLLSEGGR